MDEPQNFNDVYVCNISVDQCLPVVLPELQKELKDVANQYWLIGCYLNLSTHELQNVATNNRCNAAKCINDILQYWFERGESVTWHKVAHVMDLILRTDISTHIRRKYCGVQVKLILL